MLRTSKNAPRSRSGQKDIFDPTDSIKINFVGIIQQKKSKKNTLFVLEEGLEPSLLAKLDFESSASTIPPLQRDMNIA